MKIYLDLVMILNFSFDLLLLLSVAIVLKRMIKFTNLIISSFIGGLSILFLFLNINSFELFIFKFIVSIIMILVCFGYKNIKYTFNNLIFLYINSIALGGFLYFLSINFAYKNDGLVFYFNGLSINFIFLLILSPLIIYLYIKQLKKLKNNYNNYYNVDIYFNDKKYSYIGFCDSGNSLTYKNIPVILIDQRKILFEYLEYKLLPYQALNFSGLLKIIKPLKVVINGNIKNCYLGLMENSLSIDGVDVLLNKKLGG